MEWNPGSDRARLAGALTSLAPLAVLVLAGCGSPIRPEIRDQPSPGPDTAVLRELSGPARLSAAGAARDAHAGDRISTRDTLLLPTGSAALVVLPAGSGTVWIAPAARQDQAGRVQDTTFRITGSAGIVLNGHATVTVAAGTELTALCGAAILRSTGPSSFTVNVAAGNYPDATVQVSAGTVTGSSSEGGGAPLVLSAGQQGSIRLPRGH